MDGHLRCEVWFNFTIIPKMSNFDEKIGVASSPIVEKYALRDDQLQPIVFSITKYKN